MSDTGLSLIRGGFCPDCRGVRVFERAEDGFQCSACGFTPPTSAEDRAMPEPTTTKRTRKPSFACPGCGLPGRSRINRTDRPTTDKVIRYRVCECGTRFKSVEVVQAVCRAAGK